MATILICSLFIFIGASVKDLVEMREEQLQRVVNQIIKQSLLSEPSLRVVLMELRWRKRLSLCCIISGGASEMVFWI